MNESVVNHIEKKTGVTDIVGLLAERLSGSELSSLLLAVYERRTERMTPAELLTQYCGNRLVQPAVADMIELQESVLASLRYLRDRGFHPVELSPLAALGTCSVVAAVSQDKVVSAVRNTEIVADATNVLALHVADLRKRGADELLRFSTVHRHVRTQPLTNARFSPHFVIGCMVTAGRDVGSFAFECEAMAKHLDDTIGLLRDVYGVKRFRLVLKKRGGYDERNPLIDRVEEYLGRRLEGLEIGIDPAPVESSYYKGVQFKLYMGDELWEIADGGFVDWTQRLLGNRKERLLISGFGLELLVKMKGGLL